MTLWLKNGIDKIPIMTIFAIIKLGSSGAEGARQYVTCIEKSFGTANN